MKTLFAVLLLSAAAWGQTTTVTGTVVDPNGNPYANGTISAQTVVNSGQATQTFVPTVISPTGTFSQPLPSNTSYAFTACALPVNIGPLANATPTQICFTSTPIFIGTSQIDISSQLAASAKVIGPVIQQAPTAPGGQGAFIYNNNGQFAGDLSTTDGSGDITVPGSVTIGPSPPPSSVCGSTASCFEQAESATGPTPTSGVDAFFASSAAHDFQCTRNGGALGACYFPTITAARAGDIVYWNGTAWTNLAGNNSGTSFLEESNTGVPSWAAGTGTSPPTFPHVAETANFTVSGTDFTNCRWFDVSGSTAVTATLVASGSQPSNGQCIVILNFSTAAVTIARNGQNINGAANNITLSAGSSSAPTAAIVGSDGTNYTAVLTGVGGGGAVTSVFGRTGAVVATSGDYTLTKISAGTAVSGSTIKLLAEPLRLPVALCQGAGPSLGGSAPAGNLPVANCDAGTAGSPTGTPQTGGAIFTQNASSTVLGSYLEYGPILLPSDFQALTAATVEFNDLTDTNTGHNVVFDLQGVCIAATAAATPPTLGSFIAFGTASVQATALNTNTATISSPSITCSGGQLLYLRISLDSTTTATANDVQLIAASIQWQENKLTQP